MDTKWEIYKFTYILPFLTFKSGKQRNDKHNYKLIHHLSGKQFANIDQEP